MTTRTRRLQVKPIFASLDCCEKHETKEEAINAFNEAMQNGFVKIQGSFNKPYKSPRIYPPVTCPPHPVINLASGAPKPPSPPPSPPAFTPAFTPAPAPPPPPPSTYPSLDEKSSQFDDRNVTKRSPQREKRAVNTFDGRSSRSTYTQNQSSPTKGGCGSNCHHHCCCHCCCAGNHSCRSAATNPVSAPPSPNRERRQVMKERKPEPTLTTSSRQVASAISRSKTAPAPSVQSSTPRAPLSSTISRTQSASAVQFSSPLASSSQYRSVSRSGPQDIVFLSDSETELDEDSEAESSGPEDVTPSPSRAKLLSPLSYHAHVPASGSTSRAASSPVSVNHGKAARESHNESGLEPESSGPEDVTPSPSRAKLLSPSSSHAHVPASTSRAASSPVSVNHGKAARESYDESGLEPESSGPEDVTPLHSRAKLLSPLSSHAHVPASTSGAGGVWRSSPGPVNHGKAETRLSPRERQKESGSELESSGPEDVTPSPSRAKLLSPLISPKLKATGATAGFSPCNSPSGSPRKRDAASTPIAVTRTVNVTSPRRTPNLESNDLVLTHVPAVVYNESDDPRSPIQRNRVHVSS
ncbi:hypothetical protein BT96DRAFT_13441 [Gymnopus androsaceus JB14]|uniref:Uncharacterized protein n=1 Tax=Gymnopus androsaceus JB14 TaxID=1447944 RepID=A0A6A4ILG6_9AGAR|nr:hypothetical protein BT96DRAFT_13441 [Gymnopus androsaceus JB14]